MKKIQLACMVSLLATGIAYAAVPCNGFEIVVENHLQDKLLATTLTLNGAQIQPQLVGINANDETIFTVSGSDADVPMTGEFVFKTVSLPSKTIHIEFDLKNQLLICEHSDKEIPNAYPVSHTRSSGKVVYTIG